MLYCVVRVQPIDVEQIDRAVRELIERLVEGALYEPRETAVQRIVVRAQVSEHLWPERAGLSVSRPGVDRVALRLETGLLDGLTNAQ